MKKLDDLGDLMIEQLRDLYHGEKELDKLLPKMVKSASEPALKKIIGDYLKENEGQVMRLRQSFELLYVRKRGETCEAINAMVIEANDLMKRSVDNEVMDAGLITALQHIIHYEIAGYGAVCTYAQMLGSRTVAEIIHKNLEEEKKADRKLAILAEEVVNQRAIIASA